MQEFIEKLFNIGHDASATIIITILVFVLGYIITGIGRIISNFIRRAAVRKLFLENIKSLNVSIREQERIYKVMADAFYIHKDPSWDTFKVELFQIAVFKEISYKETFQAFFTGIENVFSCKKKIKRKAFNKLWENVASAELWTNKAFNDFTPTLEKYNSYDTARAEAITTMRKAWEKAFSAGAKGQLPPNELEYYTKMGEITLDYKIIPTQERTKPFVTHRKLVLRMRILSKKYAPISNRDLNDAAMEASYQYANMRNILNVVREQYLIYKHLLRSVHKTNDTIISILG
jgi:hypothetical protein